MLITVLFFSMTSNFELQLDWFFILNFAFIMALAESMPIFYKELSLSTSFAVALSAYFLKGPIVAVIVTIVGFSFRILKYKNNYEHLFNTPWYKTAFNFCVFIVPILSSHALYLTLGGAFGGTISSNLLPLVGFTVANYLISIFMLSTVTSVIADYSFSYAFIRNAKLGIVNLVIVAPLGAIAAHIFSSFSYLGFVLFFIPLILTRFILASMIHSNKKYMQTVDVIMNALEARDSYTRGHSKRVAELSRRIAKALSYSEWQIDTLTIGALLHDIGKIGVPDHILNKTDQLTSEEFNTIKQHPEIGFNILNDVEGMDKILQIVRNHHERYDGLGYPDAKNHSQLPLNVYIVQLADSIDAMASDRPYRKALSADQIHFEILKHKGTQFHPIVVDAYLISVQK